jgi:hypothetical protein
MFSSWRRGAEASTPPAQDAFRDVFANHVLARMNARKDASGGTDRSLSKLGSTRSTNRSLSPTGSSRQADIRRKTDNEANQALSRSKKEDTTRDASSSEDSRQTAAAARKRRHQEVHKSHHKPESPTPTAGLATEATQATSQTSQNQGGASTATTPQALQDLIAFLQSFPGGSLKISPQQAPAVASYLQSAGLPQSEVDRLLTPDSNQEISLNAADLQAAWQQAAGQGQATVQTAAASQPAGATNQAANQPQQAQEIQQTPGYRAVWEKLTLPQNMVPTVRLALARLGASPQALAQLDDQGQGQGIPLTRVWQVLQGIKDGVSPGGGASDQTGATAAAEAAQEAVLGQQKVTGTEVQDWQQVLLKTGLPPEVVEKLLGQKSVGTQEQLKDSLLAAAPAVQPTPILAEPKPLYQPQDLQMRPFYWQSNLGGDQPQLNGDGSEAKGQDLTAQLAAPAPAPATPVPGENLALSAFATEIQGLTQGTAGTTGPLSETGSSWPTLPPEVRESLWAQLQAGITTNLDQGENKVTLNLNPPELGQIQLTLNLSGQNLSVTGVATRPEAAALASLGMPQLVQALAQQGFVLTDFQVRLQNQPERPISPVLAGTREKGSAPGGQSSSSRRRSGEVDRFV